MQQHKTDFSKIERAFAELCRTGVDREVPGLKKAQAKIYRDLVFNNIQNTLERAYPITLQIMGKRKFRNFIETFHAKHDHHFPELWKMPKGLLDFSRKCRMAKKLHMPFLDDLLEFEWIEIEIHMMPDVNPSPDQFKSTGSCLQDRLILNRESQVLLLQYPVFRPVRRGLDKQKGDYFLLAFRHPEHLDVEFIELSPLSALLYENLSKTKGHVSKAIQKTLRPIPKKNRAQIETEGLSFYEHLLAKGACLGFALIP